MWSCAFWQLTMQTTWRCRSTLPCYSPSAATAASPSCESQEFSGSSSCWVLWMPTETRKSTETSTACLLRWVDSAQQPSLMQLKGQSGNVLLQMIFMQLKQLKCCFTLLAVSEWTFIVLSGTFHLFSTWFSFIPWIAKPFRRPDSP